MRYLLALDQGTTSSRAFAIDEDGQIATRAQRPLACSHPQPGWVEQNPMEIWSTQLAAAREAFRELQHVDAMRKASFANSSYNLHTKSKSLVIGLGIANQRETTLVWERATGRPIYNAIVWQDRRTAAACDALREQGHADTIRAKTGLMLDPYFSATKLAWILHNVPQARARAESGELCFGTVDSWLVFRLSNGKTHVTDGSNASRTMLYNIHQQCWDDELLALFDIPRSMLPEVVHSTGAIARCDASHFGVDLAIAGMAGDQQAACYGQMCQTPGAMKNTYGTGSFMLMNTGGVAVSPKNKVVATIGWNTDDMLQPATYFLEGSVFMAGATVQWLRDNLGMIRHASDIEELAGSVSDCGDVYLVPAFVGLGAPHWDPQARACLIGMGRDTHRGHIARAALEAIALQTVDVHEAMREDAPAAADHLRVDGGASVNNLLLQIQADYLGLPVVRSAVTEATAMGVAYLAGLGVGLWGKPQDFASHWQQDRVFEPTISADERLAKMARWKKALTRSRMWAEK
jgi:glycerol kinase